MEVQVEILKQTITTQYGTLNQGDILRTNRAFASHLVDDCCAAKYSAPLVTQQPAAAVEALEEQLVVGATGVPTVEQPELDSNVAASVNAVAIDADVVQSGPPALDDATATDTTVQTSAQDAEGASAEPSSAVTRKKTSTKKEG